MTIPLREYLAQRRSDIQAQIKALRAELAEVDVAERALGAGGDASPQRKERGTAGSGKKTLKEMAVEVLRDHREGLEASVILSEIEKRWGVTIQRESLSPQLSRLGAHGDLVRNGLVWTLAHHDWTMNPAGGQKDETPGVQPPGASESAEEIEIDVLG